VVEATAAAVDITATDTIEDMDMVTIMATIPVTRVTGMDTEAVVAAAVAAVHAAAVVVMTGSVNVRRRSMK